MAMAMAMAKAGSSADLSEIQRRMAQIRHEMHAEVQGAVRGAQSLTDWRSMVAEHPWGALGIAAAVGYLAVPHRRSRSNARRAADLAATVAAVSRVEAARQPVGSPVAKPSFVRSALGLFAPVLIRAAQNYALNQVEQWLLANPRQSKDSSNPERHGEPRGAGPGDEDAGAHTVRFREPR